MPQAARCFFLKDNFGRLESGYIEGENYKFFQGQQQFLNGKLACTLQIFDWVFTRE
jgi:hypothetical protein